MSKCTFRYQSGGNCRLDEDEHTAGVSHDFQSNNKELNNFILSLEMLQRNWKDDYGPVQALVIDSLKYAYELKQLRNDVFYLRLDNDSLADELKIALRDKDYDPG